MGSYIVSGGRRASRSQGSGGSGTTAKLATAEIVVPAAGQSEFQLPFVFSSIHALYVNGAMQGRAEYSASGNLLTWQSSDYILSIGDLLTVVYWPD